MPETNTGSLSMVLGHEVVGAGSRHVVVMNDWLCDTSTWDEARKYLDGARFTFVFADLRGYGRSRGRTGTFALREAAADILVLADALNWPRFAIVGHSMSTLVALHLAQHHADRIERAVLLTPPPSTGFGVDDATLVMLQTVALGDDTARQGMLAQQWGTRLPAAWTNYKAGRWSACADRAAVAGYVAMFARDGLSDPTAPIVARVLAITGEQDAPPMRGDAVTQNLAPLCTYLTVTPLADVGHYPMQEMPPLTVALVERFLSE